MKQMNNKILLSHIAFLILVLSIFTSCNDDKEFKDVTITAVEKFYEPLNDKAIVLENIQNVFFEWERSIAEDNSIVYYEILFMKENGNPAEPDYRTLSYNNGIAPSASFEKREMNRIAGLLGIGAGETETIKWTVQSYRGINTELAKVTHNLTITRLTGIDLEGAELQMSGPATEQGQTFAYDSEDDKYIIYTKLLANQDYFFSAEKEGTTRTFALDEKLTETTNKEVPLTNKVETEGIYRITLDLGTAEYKIETVEEVTILWDTTDGIVHSDPFVYQGKGKWKYTNFHFNMKPTGWSWDPVERRFKFNFKVNGEYEGWSGKSADEASITDTEFFYLYPVPAGLWDGQCTRFPNEVSGDENNHGKYYADVVVDMSGENGPFTHRHENIHE